MKKPQTKSRSEAGAFFKREASAVAPFIHSCRQSHCSAKAIEVSNLARQICDLERFEKLDVECPPGHSFLTVIARSDEYISMGMGWTEQDDIIAWRDETWYLLTIVESLHFLMMMHNVSDRFQTAICYEDEGHTRLLRRLTLAVRK
jgi:hypothetical protein